MDVTQEPDFDVRELSSTGRQLEVDLGGAVHLTCPQGKEKTKATIIVYKKVLYFLLYESKDDCGNIF